MQECLSNTDDTTVLFLEGETFEFARARVDYGSADDAHATGALTAPMPGKVCTLCACVSGVLVTVTHTQVVSLVAKVGDALKKGDAILIIEAMKMVRCVADALCQRCRRVRRSMWCARRVRAR
jgi:biotin carboxyl carrier protein